MAPDGRAIPSVALLATPRPRSQTMAATSDADRPPTVTHSVPLQLAPHSDAAPDEKPGTISNASLRLRALAALSGSLTDSLTAEEAADLVEQQALTVLGASSAVVVTLAQAGARDVLTLVHAIGLTADVTATLRQFSLDAPGPLA